MSLIACPAVRRTSWTLLNIPHLPHRQERLSGSIDSLQAGIWPVLPTYLGTWSPVDHHDVGGEVIVPAHERRSDAIGVDGHALGLAAGDLFGVEAAGGGDPRGLVP